MNYLALAAVLASTPTPTWPRDLTVGWTALTVKHSAPGEEARSAQLKLGSDGVWKVLVPWRGDADIDAIGRLKLALEAPQLLTSAPQASTPRFEIELRQGNRVRRVVTQRAGLNQPILAVVDSVPFTVAPGEFSTKIPDPTDFAPPGLWVAAKDDAISLEVKGPASYKLVGRGEDWKTTDGRTPNRELDDVVGVIVGRQAHGHPTVDLKALGLNPPTATAKLCTPRACREFRFGAAGGRYYALAPDSDPLELRDNDWKLLVEGPFKKKDAGE